MPSAPVLDGIPVGAFMPYLYQHPELFKVRALLVDNYDFYKQLNLTREEMATLVAKGIMSIDPLTGSAILEYLK